MATELHPQGVALLSALNELFAGEWMLTPGVMFYTYVLKLDVPGRLPFFYSRPIKPEHINAEPFRTALAFTDEVCDRYGRYVLLKPEEDE